MAGYMIYSLDNALFQKFCVDPSEEQLLALANEVSIYLDDYAEDEIDGQTLAEWPVEPEELIPILKQRMTQQDWFAGLTNNEKSHFDSVLRGFFCERDNGFDFRCEVDDGIYWDVVELMRAHHQIPPNTINDKILSRFGTKPLYATLEEGKIPGFDTWAPYFSMHRPEDVAQLRDEVLAAESTVMDSDDDNAKREYQDELLPALDKMIDDQRLLFVVLDT